MILNKKIQVFLNWWGSRNYFVFVVIGLLLTYIIPSLLIQLLNILDFNLIRQHYNKVDYFSYLIVAPIFETLLCQVLLIYFIEKFISNSKIVQVLISAIIFGILHFQSLAVIIATTGGGLVFGTAYLLYKKITLGNLLFLPLYLYI